MTRPLAPRAANAILAVAAAALVPPGLPAQPRTAPLPRVTAEVRALAGCYRLTTRWLDTPRDYPGAVALPPVVRLDTVPQRYVGRTPDFHAGPAITSYHELPSEPGWQPYGRDSLVVSWWDAYTGPTLVLGRAGAEWRGIATYAYHEDRKPGPRMAVTASPTACR
jgi:hypothetical protein